MTAEEGARVRATDGLLAEGISYFRLVHQVAGVLARTFIAQSLNGTPVLPVN